MGFLPPHRLCNGFICILREVHTPTITIDNMGRQAAARPVRVCSVPWCARGKPIQGRYGGRARWGCCRVCLLFDGRGTSPLRPRQSRLGSEALAEGWRLARQTHLAATSSFIYRPPGNWSRAVRLKAPVRPRHGTLRGWPVGKGRTVIGKSAQFSAACRNFL